ncbi:monomeric sarcosine oxidase [Williamsia limnetica]|uniref:Monomeric sarcosine oxidase n=1 Tax=Williamsia limnetica TaxID=882452 RepID=A0A318RP10_WILLI|nr:N-methyl-L-tryptophan oxidase [Williamsia limnetica]PYE13274.1 monomeric sarcosine oxidase [Williamsia limnetica]
MNNTTYDVIVLGLGGMGSAAAYHLASRGARVLGLERFTPAHDQGSSHGGSRIIRQSYFEDPAYVPLLLRSYELWEKLKQDSEIDVYSITGGLFMGPEESMTFSGSRRASEQWGLAHEVLTDREVHRRFPAFDPAPGHMAVYERMAGFARPESTVQAHIGLAQQAGAELHFGEPVTLWSDTGDGVLVTTEAGTYRAAQLVVCPGAWAPKLLADIGIPIRIERQVMYWIAPVAESAPMDGGPIYIHETDGFEQIYGFPPIDGPGGGAKVAFFRKGEDCTPETIDRTVHRHEIEAMVERVGRLLPGLTGSVLDTATCMYSTTPDENFVIARHPGHRNVTVACGFSGHGFKFVPVVGEILADLAIDGVTDHPIDLFDPNRLADV